jgi:hypothetical protein
MIMGALPMVLDAMPRLRIPGNPAIAVAMWLQGASSFRL